jgi:hypothetical protein
MDMIVSDTLETEFGLLAFRDLHNHYQLRTEGPFELRPDGSPLALGRMRLERRPLAPA